MNFLWHLVMIGWVPTVLALFSMIEDRRRAVIVSYLFAWLFLPFGGYSITGIPDFNKFSATSLSVMLAVLVFDPVRLLAMRPRWFDIPAVVFCVSPLVTSLLNKIGLYDGITGVFSQLTLWGFPYLVGRMYFSDLKGIFELAMGIFIGALIYVPMILLESRFAPQLHIWVYGIPTRLTSEQISFFGPLRWKPSVFMDSALAVTMFMASASICGVWIWMSGGLRRLWNMPMGYLAFAVFCGAVLSKSLGALALMMGGLGAAFVIKIMRRPIPIICLVLVAPTYMTVRATGVWTGRDLVTWVGESMSETRAGSLQTRLENEELLLPKALEKRWFGWGRWGRALVYDARGNNISIPDGLWVIVIGQSGVIGLVSLYAMLLLPPVRLLFRQPVAFWAHPAASGAVGLTIVLLIYSVDCLLNAMVNPIFTVAAGGLMSLPVLRLSRARSGPRRTTMSHPGLKASRTPMTPVSQGGRAVRDRAHLDLRGSAS